MLETEKLIHVSERVAALLVGDLRSDFLLSQLVQHGSPTCGFAMLLQILLPSVLQGSWHVLLLTSKEDLAKVEKLWSGAHGERHTCTLSVLPSPTRCQSIQQTPARKAQRRQIWRRFYALHCHICFLAFWQLLRQQPLHVHLSSTKN